jgi:uncharacterized membrane protein YfcA
MSASPAHLAELAALLLVIGGFAGVLAGLFGVGGGIVLVPAFYYAFASLGYDGPQIMQICLASSLATIIFTSARSLQGHHARGAVDWTVLRGWAPGLALGAVLAVLIAGGLRTATLMRIFGVFGLCLGLWVGFGPDPKRLEPRMPSSLARMALAPLVGFSSVLMGIGGGIAGVAIMRLSGVPFIRAVATASGFGILIAVPSVIAFMTRGWDAALRPPFSIGLVNLPAVVIIVTATLITTPLGVRLAHALPPLLLRRSFGAFAILMALNMLRKAAAL